MHALASGQCCVNHTFNREPVDPDSYGVLCRENEAMVRELQTPAPGSKLLSFKNHYSTGLLSQVNSCTLSNSPDKLHSWHPRHVLACMPVLGPLLHITIAPVQLNVACAEAPRTSAVSFLLPCISSLHLCCARVLEF